MVFVIHWHESAMDLHVFSIPIPPPTSLSNQFLWVFPVHQAWALVSCIQPRLVICFTLVNIHVSMLFSQNIPPSPSPRVQKSVLYICVSFSVFWCLWFLIHCLGLSSRFAIISHASKVFLKFCKPGFNSMWTMNFKMFKLDLVAKSLCWQCRGPRFTPCRELDPTCHSKKIPCARPAPAKYYHK